MALQRSAGAGPRGGPEDRGEAWGDFEHLIRQTHIFASVARDILEVKYLDEVSPSPLTLPQFHLLRLISVNGDHQVGEVADFLGISGPAVTKNADKLERLGLVERKGVPGDRRGTVLCASPEGRRLVRRYESVKQRRLTPVFEHFTRQDLEKLAKLMERFSLAVIEREDSGDGMCMRCAAYFEDACPVSRVRGDCAYQELRHGRHARRQAAAGGARGP